MNIIRKIKDKISKILVVLDAIETINVSESGSVYIKTKEHVILDTKGSLVLYSKEGKHVFNADHTYVNTELNPALITGKDIPARVEEIVYKSEEIRENNKKTTICECEVCNG